MGLSEITIVISGQVLLGYLKLLYKLQKWICRTVDPSFAVSLEPLAHHRNLASLSLLYRYYFGRCSSELAHLFLLSYSQGSSTHYSDRSQEFSVTIVRCYKISMSTVIIVKNKTASGGSGWEVFTRISS